VNGWSPNLHESDLMMMDSSLPAPVVKRAYLATYIAVPLAGLLLYSAAWGWPSSLDGFRLWAAMAMYVVSIPLHEALHYCGFVLWGGADPRDVELKFSRESMSPYVVCRANTTVIRYKVAALLPFVFVGILPFMYGLFEPDPTVYVVSVFNMTACAGDLILYFLLSRLANHNMVARHGERIGFVVVA
jgi:hypothetical protein